MRETTTTKSLDAILADFSTEEPKAADRAVTIWVPAEYKARYDRLQKVSDRRFCKKVREALLALIELAEERVT